MLAAYSVGFRLNPSCPEVNESCLPHNKNNSDKTVHNLQLASAGIRSWKTRAEHYILLFSLKKHWMENFGILGDFSAFIFRTGSSVHKVSYPCSKKCYSIFLTYADLLESYPTPAHTQSKCRTLWCILHRPVILPYLVNGIYCLSVIIWCATHN